MYSGTLSQRFQQRKNAKATKTAHFTGHHAYCHCTSRCVRKTFLCSTDFSTGKSYEHRRQWVEDRILFLAEVFAIDVCAFAVMSNHHHLVLHINKRKLLSPFVGNPCEPMPQGLPFKLEDYINLIDLTGRAIRDDKRGYIENNFPCILDRLDIEPKQWLYLTTQFESRFKNLVGSAYALKKAAPHMAYKRRPGFCDCKALL